MVPGRVSTEVDAHLSFDAAATVDRAQVLADLYRAKGVARRSVLIKIAATWEGILAAKILEEGGIHCNMTLIFSLEQAVACAEAGATLISPFVGRVLDWHMSNNPEFLVNGPDPGVELVRSIFTYLKKWGYKTEIMAASFRHVGEIVALAGCDWLTIGPKFLDELARTEGVVDPGMASAEDVSGQKLRLGESDFRLSLNENRMAEEKLSEGIRLFCRDIRRLRELVGAQR
jgi:transaldolase